MVFGITIFEVTSKSITILEANHDFGSILYLILVVFATLGLMLAVHQVLTIYFEIKDSVKTTSNTFTN